MAYFMAYLWIYCAYFAYCVYFAYLCMVTNASCLCCLFSEFPKNKNDRSAKTDNYNFAMNAIYNLLHMHTLPEELEPSSESSLPAQQACRPTNLATDPLHILIPSLLCTPAEGPALHVPPPATVFAVLSFVARSAWKVGRFPSQLIRYRPCIANRNKRQPSQYGGHWNHIQDLR